MTVPRLVGRARVPGDKSIAHRALVLAGLARGDSVIGGLPDGLDVLATRRCLERLGVAVTVESGGVRLRPPATWRAGESLDAVNSGTTARLLLGALAGAGTAARVAGDESLALRPMERVAAPLRSLGARVELSDGRLPARVEAAPLHGGAWRAQVASAQVKSAFLLAALGAQGASSYEEPVPTRDHLERMFPTFGLSLERRGDALVVEGPAPPAGARFQVPGDPSSAAVFVVAACLLPGSDVTVEGVALNPTRTEFVAALLRAGARVDATAESDAAGEPLGTIRARGGELEGFEVGAREVPLLVDELPLLALAAAFARGESTFRSLGELRHKESDRLAAIVSLLDDLGVDHELAGDDLVVHGGRPAARARGFDARGDHRLAMLSAVVALCEPGWPAVRDEAVVAVSWPTFYDDLAALVR